MAVLVRIPTPLRSLTKGQAEYLGIKVEGPFKPDNYRY